MGLIIHCLLLHMQRECIKYLVKMVAFLFSLQRYKWRGESQVLYILKIAPRHKGLPEWYIGALKKLLIFAILGIITIMLAGSICNIVRLGCIKKKEGSHLSSLTDLFFLHSSLTLVLLRQSGKSSSTTTTNGITASGETALVALSMNANRMRHEVLCGSTKRPSIEDG